MTAADLCTSGVMTRPWLTAVPLTGRAGMVTSPSSGKLLVRWR